MKKSTIILGGLTAALVTASPIQAALTGYLKIDGIDGEYAARDSGDAHLDYLVITMTNAGVQCESTKPVLSKTASRPQRASTGGAGGAGKVKFDRLSIKKFADTEFQMNCTSFRGQ